MLVIPAIDLKDGACVRLKQGIMAKSTVFADNPLDMAQKWFNLGAKRLHIVDLNGAFAGEPVNAKQILAITKTYPELEVQIGGGIRSISVAQKYIDAGVAYLIIGTKAVIEPDFVARLCQLFPKQIIVGLDANDDMVATDGWAKTSDKNIYQLATQFESYGVSSIIYTDIAKDGMLDGVNIATTLKLAQHTNIPIIASGGITNIDDIAALSKVAHNGILGAITGRAIYEGSLNFKEAQQVADKFNKCK